MNSGKFLFYFTVHYYLFFSSFNNFIPKGPQKIAVFLKHSVTFCSATQSCVITFHPTFYQVLVQHVAFKRHITLWSKTPIARWRTAYMVSIDFALSTLRFSICSMKRNFDMKTIKLHVCAIFTYFGSFLIHKMQNTKK